MPPFDGPKTDPLERVELRALASARALVVCEKEVMLVALDDMKSLRKPSLAHAKRLSLAKVPPLPSREAVDVIVDYARDARVPVAFLGDLDPVALHAFAALRAGGREAFLRGARQRLDVAWLGVDSTWLAWLDRLTGDVRSFTTKMHETDRAYWEVVQTLMPDVRALLGRRASELLDGGATIQMDAIFVRLQKPCLRELSRRLSPR